MDILTQNSQQTIAVIDPEKSYSYFIAQELFIEGFEIVTFDNADDCELFCKQNDINLAIVLVPQIADEIRFVRSLTNVVQADNPQQIIVLTDTINDDSLNFYRDHGLQHIMRRQDDLRLFKRLVFKLINTPISPPKKPAFNNIIGKDVSMQKVFQWVERIAQSEMATVFIRGESGTGKELIARAIHENSRNADQPFVEINCAALPDHLLESELFGYEKGAFTDAQRMKKGLLELADGGTFFLDEIGDLNVRLQVKLVKALEEKVFRRLGGTEDIRVSMRIMAATNRDVEKAVEDGHFREDLYFRLHVLSLYLPPLRERGNDLLLIADHFRNKFNDEHGCQITGFSNDAKALLLSYPWPGNVRELKNAIERAVLLGQQGEITTGFLQLGRRQQQHGGFHLQQENGTMSVSIPESGISLEAVEKALLQKSMEMAAGNKAKAARLLHLSRETLRYRLRKFNLD
ncbi:MAG: sigma-54-dependent Fis family transcriptional regulator [Deferribacteres bacterium]|nr:sigma-54-dependent Fis family transcriptional regulator [candidate division KSB1 bacterium]MCB9503960.1 sigma-54-dependent Fis family transcriptional regulator [Deferribacteres bacterium]